MCKKLQLWKGKLFSVGGREVLIKAVDQATSTFTMSVFKIPSSMGDELQSLISRFWWSGSIDEQKIQWVRWEKLCRSKAEGGMGLRDLSAFHKALLAKQGWRIVNCPNSLMARILKAKYFPSADFLNAGVGHNASFTWQKFLLGS